MAGTKLWCIGFIYSFKAFLKKQKPLLTLVALVILIQSIIGWEKIKTGNEEVDSLQLKKEFDSEYNKKVRKEYV